MKNICSFWIWLQYHVSVKLQQKQQKGEKASGTKKKQLEEHFVTNYVNLQQVSDILSLKTAS